VQWLKRDDLAGYIEKLKEEHKRRKRERKIQELSEQIERLKLKKMRNELEKRKAMQREIDKLRAEAEELVDEEPDFLAHDWGELLSGTLINYRLSEAGEIAEAGRMSQKIRIMSTPFAAGSFRNAFYCKVGTTPRVGKIFKEFVKDERKACEMDIEQLLVAENFAQQFNSKNPPKKVHYVKPQMFKLDKEWKGSSYIFLEPKLQGRWTKFNNNHEYVSRDEDKCRTAQAFSHFSYDASGGQKMVTDVQGVQQDDDSLLLTDPAIHTLDHRYGPSDLGEKGVKGFFTSHACNVICRTVGNKRSTFQKKAFDDSATVLKRKDSPRPDLDPDDYFGF